VQKRTVVACVRLTTAQGAVEQEVRTFGTMTADLLALSDWLAGYAVEPVAMEATGATGVYWRAVFNVLEAGHAVILVNPQHMRAVPGARPMSRMRSGWRICWRTACCGPASSRPPRYGRCGS
jgi:transposase